MNRAVRFIFHLLAVIVVGYAVLLNFARIIAPQLSHHIPFYESWVEQTLHEPVTIHDVKTYWSGFGPEIHFNQVVVYKRENHLPLIKIQHLAMGVNIWLSLFEWRLVPAKLSIAGTHIDVYQDSRGQLQITGMPKLANNQHRNKGKLIDFLFWLLTEADISVNNVDVSLHNVKGMNVALHDIQMRVTNTLLQHRLSAVAQLQQQQQQPARIQLIAYLQGTSLQDQNLQAKAYIKLQNINMPVAKGGMQAWLNIQRKHLGLNVHVDDVQASVQLPKLYNHPLEIRKMAGDFAWQPLVRGWSLDSPSFYWTDGNIQQRGTFYIVKQAQHPMVMHVLSRFRVQDVARIRDDVPQQGINRTLSHWLRAAFKAGYIPDAELMVEGSHINVLAQVKQASLKFNPDWPAITNGDASLMFQDKRMLIHSNKAMIAEIPLSQVSVEIPDLLHPRLLINGQAAGSVAEGKYFLMQTPLDFAHDFNHVDVSGLMHLWLHLNVCLYCKHVSVHTQGLLRLRNAGLRLPRWHIPLTQVNGDVTFADHNLQSNNLRGFLFKQPVRLQVSTDVKSHHKSTVQVLLTSNLGEKEFSQILPLVRPYIQGESLFQVLLQLRDDANPLGNEVTLVSHLKGIALTNLPHSLLKSASKNVISRIKIGFKDQQPTLLAVHYANRLSLLAQLKQGDWKLWVMSHFAAGTLVVSPDFMTVWQGHLQYLYLPVLKQSNASSWKQRIAHLPSIHLSVANLYYGHTALGSLSLIANNQAHQFLVKDCHLRLLNQYNIDVSGRWHYAKPVTTQVSGWVLSDNFANLLSQLGYPKILSGGNGYIQGVLHWPGAPWQLNIKTLQGKLAWHLSDGNLLKINKSTSDALGFSKLLNVLSIQSILQNVSNTVSGTSNKGFPFSSFKAMLSLHHDRATLNQFNLDGPVANILVHGQVGLLDKRYRLMITVRPYFTSSAPLIAGILGGPIVGAVVWAANKVIEPAIGRIAAYHYQLTGSWNHPIMKQMKGAKQHT